MRSKIGRRVFDTETAQEIGKQTISYFGDSYGFEEVMYRKSEDVFFLWVNGGADSQYPEEQIIPLSLTDAKNWIERICGHDYAEQVVPPALFEPKPAKKPVEKKPAAKKPAAKKPAAKKPAVKKPAAKKTAVTRAAVSEAPAARSRKASAQPAAEKKGKARP